jgi:hypothetical protein
VPAGSVVSFYERKVEGRTLRVAKVSGAKFGLFGDRSADRQDGPTECSQQRTTERTLHPTL